METKMNEFRGHFATPLPGAVLGRVLDGFWEGFEGIWVPWGGPNGHENRYISKEIQVLPLGSPKEGFG